MGCSAGRGCQFSNPRRATISTGKSHEKLMKRVVLSLLLAAVFGAALAPTRAQQSATSAAAPTTINRSGAPVDVNHIIRTMAAKETEFRTALNNYQFKRDAVIQTVAMGGQVSGEYRRVSSFIFDDSGRRFEKILLFPIPTITAVSITPEDLEDLGGVQAFALEASKINQYDFAYVGKERIDELDLHVFDVTPKLLSDSKRVKDAIKAGERYFQGRVWVDEQDLQIVKARGKGVPEGEQRFPVFETYRENIDGRFWFPTYAYADDELVFKNGAAVHLRMRIRYTDFAPLKGKFRVIEEGEPGEDEPAKPAPTPTPTPAKPPKP